MNNNYDSIAMKMKKIENDIRPVAIDILKEIFPHLWGSVIKDKALFDEITSRLIYVDNYTDRNEIVFAIEQALAFASHVGYGDEFIWHELDNDCPYCNR